MTALALLGGEIFDCTRPCRWRNFSGLLVF